jgi:DNA-binding winged helix-turn-helix (wHTH) protein
MQNSVVAIPLPGTAVARDGETVVPANRPALSPRVDRRGERPNRLCVIVSERVLEAAALQVAVSSLVSTVRVAAPNEIGEELWNTAAPRVLIARGPEGVSALEPWIVLLQSLPNTATLALLDGGPSELLTVLRQFDTWLPGRTPAAVVAQQVHSLLLLLERQARLTGPRRIRGVNLIVDLGREEATNSGGERIPLTPSEFRLLSVMAAQPGRVVDFGQLGVSLPGHFRDADDAYNSVKVHIGRLRQKLARWTGWDGHLVSVRGRGFLFERRLDSNGEPDEVEDDEA